MHRFQAVDILSVPCFQLVFESAASLSKTIRFCAFSAASPLGTIRVIRQSSTEVLMGSDLRRIRETESSLNQTHRAGFTLIELLLVIIIIAILAGLGVGLMAQVQNDASIAATRSRITFISSILETELEDYEFRRLPVPLPVIGSMIAQDNLLTNREETFLIHAKVLKRMLVADLIRAEMPDGSFSGRNVIANNGPVDIIGEFPTPAFAAFLNNLNIDHSPLLPYQFATEAQTWARFRATPGQRGWAPVVDTNPNDDIIEDAASRSELLFQILQNIEIDGVPVTEKLGPRGTGDSNSNGFPEVIDGWGEPIFLQWQAIRMGSQDTATGIWTLHENGTDRNGDGIPDTPPFCGLSCEHATRRASFADYVTPVLPSQIRPFLTSERLLRIDGVPTDYQPLFE